jgi:DNA polymerase elongation subunit (family B)
MSKNGISTIQIQAYDWTEHDNYTDDGHYSIHCYALDKESKPYLVRYNDFPAFCFIELPQRVWGRPYTWNKNSAQEVADALSMRLGDHAPIRAPLQFHKKLYYYRGNKQYPMLQAQFNSLEAMKHCTNLLKKPFYVKDRGCLELNVWENDISPTRKLLTVQNIRFCQWYSVRARLVPDDEKISTLEHEYIAEWDTMEAIPLEECKNWATNPGVLAFDIECYSSNKRAMPDKHNSKDVAYMISCIFQRYRQPETRKRYGIVIGNCNEIPPDKLANCTLISVNSEQAMVEAFGKVVTETDPEVVTGYNIFGFDYPYLNHRVLRRLNTWPVMGRLIGEKSKMTSKTWASGAYGTQSINILQMEGRISVDLLTIIRRDYKLDKYDLNTVCKKFIGKGKHDITAQQMFAIYDLMTEAEEEFKSLCVENGEVDPEKLQDIIQNDKAKEIIAKHKRAKDEMTKVMEYCIQDSELVIELMEKLHIWIWMIEMSSIVGVTPVQLFTRGQTFRCVSMLYNLAARSGYVIDSRQVPGFRYGGGFVFETISGLWDLIICLDFASLYPSIIQAFNICFTTLIAPEIDHLVPDSECEVIDFDQEEDDLGNPENQNAEAEREAELEAFQDVGALKKRKKGKSKNLVTKHYRLRFHQGQEGLLPRLVRELVMERRAVNRQIFGIKDETKALEKIEDIYQAVVKYTNGTLKVLTIEEANDEVKRLAKIEPPPEPSVLTAAKRDLFVAHLFNLESTRKRLQEAKDAKVHASLLTMAELEVKVAESVKHSGFLPESLSENHNNLLEILHELEVSRKDRMSLIEANKLLVTTLDKRQLGLKVSANSFYGVLGSQNGKIQLIEGAMAITAKGRQLIGQVREYIEERYQGQQVSGDTDSLTGCSGIIIRVNNKLDIVQIKDLIPLNPMPIGEQKEFYNLENEDIEVWTDKGWSKIKYLMRKRTSKQLYRVLTTTGMVEVTEDHALILNDGITNTGAKELVTGTRTLKGTLLLHNDLPNMELDSTLTEDEAWVMGFFMAEGTCGTYFSKENGKPYYSWGIGNKDHFWLNRVRDILNVVEPDCNFKVLFCSEKNGCDTLRPSCGMKDPVMKDLVERWEPMFYTNRHETKTTHKGTDLGLRYKKVPDVILMAPNHIKLAFFKGWYAGDGSMTECTDFVPYNPTTQRGMKKLRELPKEEQEEILSTYHRTIAERKRIADELRPQLEEQVQKSILKTGKPEDYERFMKSAIARYKSVKLMTEWCTNNDPSIDKLSLRTDIKGQIGAAGLYYLASALGWKVSIGERLASKDSKPDVFRLNIGNGYQTNSDMVKKVIPMGPCLEDVFDIETENHHFACGIGRMVVHNSVMIRLPQITSPEQCNYWGVRLSQEISGIKPGERDVDGVLWPEGRKSMCNFKPPLAMEFEKAMRMLAFCKKKYSYYMIGKDGKFKTEPILDREGNEIGQRLITIEKGNLLARREHCNMIRKVYKKIKDLIMDKRGFDEAMVVLIDAVMDLLAGKVDYKDLAAIKGYTGAYKAKGYFMKIFGDELIKAGKIVCPGDRLEYLVIDDPSTEVLGKKMRLLEQYEESVAMGEPYQLDYLYYADRSLKNPLNQLISVGFADVIKKLPHITFKPPGKKKTLGLHQPVDLMIHLYLNGIKLEKLKECILRDVKRLNAINEVTPSGVQPLNVRTLSIRPTQKEPEKGQSTLPFNKL